MAEENFAFDSKSRSLVAALSAIGALLAGGAALFGALLSLFNGQFVGGGLCLLAAGVAFGLLANATSRNSQWPD